MKTSFYICALSCAFVISIHSEIVFAVVYDDSVTIWNMNVNENCGSRYIFDITQSNDSIFILERDTSKAIAKCDCMFDLSITLKGVTAGHYTVIVHRRLSPEFPIDTLYFIGKTEFTVGGSLIPFSFRPYQSPCGGHEPIETPTFTSKHWLPNADSAAKSIYAEAVLQNIKSDDVSVDGTSTLWKYKFNWYDQNNKRAEYLFFHNNSTGIVFDSSSMIILDGPANLSAEWFDSDSALAYAESEGGKIFRENNPNYFISASIGEALVPNSYPYWQVLYRSQIDSTKELSIYFDARIKRDSLVDVFPLEVGNQWIYNYDYEFRDYGGVYDKCSDTGTVNLEVIDKINTEDSIRWIVKEVGIHWVQYDSPNWSGPIAQTDTFEIVESNSDNHELYRTGDPKIIHISILPFLEKFSDSSKIYRYGVVDSNGFKTVHSNESQGGPFFLFNFKQGVGLSSVKMGDGCLCLPYYWTNHTLRNSIITKVSAQNPNQLPHNFILYQNYPNPFNPSTTFKYQLPKSSYIILKVYDLVGRVVTTLVDEEKSAGEHTVQWNASTFTSGVYFYRLQANSLSETKKLLLLK